MGALRVVREVCRLSCLTDRDGIDRPTGDVSKGVWVDEMMDRQTDGTRGTVARGSGVCLPCASCLQFLMRLSGGGRLRWEPMASAGGLLILCGWPLAGEEPAAPLYRGSPPLGACLGHSQRPASCPRTSPGHTRDQRSWPRRSDPRQPGFPSSGSPGRCALAAWCPLRSSPLCPACLCPAALEITLSFVLHSRVL